MPAGTFLLARFDGRVPRTFAHMVAASAVAVSEVMQVDGCSVGERQH